MESDQIQTGNKTNGLDERQEYTTGNPLQFSVLFGRRGNGICNADIFIIYADVPASITNK